MNAQVNEVIRNTELVVVETALAEMNKVTVGLADLTKRYKGVVFEVTDKKGMAEAKAARKEIAAPRIALEKIRERAKAPILELGRKVDAEAKRIKEQLEALEGPINSQILAEEQRIEDERLALVEAEQARVDGIQKRIADMQVSVHTAAQARTAADVEKLMAVIDGTVIDESFAEYQDTAADTKARVYENLKATHASFVARETEGARLAAERAELDKRRAEQEARDKVAREQREAETAAENERLRKEREKFEADQAAAHEAQRVENERIAAEQAAAQTKIDEERRILEAAQKEARERQEASEKAERDAAAERERLAREHAARVASETAAATHRAEKAAALSGHVRDFKPKLEDIIEAVADYYTVDDEVALGWIMDAVKDAEAE